MLTQPVQSSMVNNDAGLSKTSNGPVLRNRFPDGPNGHYKPQGTRTENNERRDAKTNSTGILSAASHATLPTWVTMVLMVSMIFGGCCSNVRIILVWDQGSSL